MDLNLLTAQGRALVLIDDEMSFVVITAFWTFRSFNCKEFFLTLRDFQSGATLKIKMLFEK